MAVSSFFAMMRANACISKMEEMERIANPYFSSGPSRFSKAWLRRALGIPEFPGSWTMDASKL